MCCENSGAVFCIECAYSVCGLIMQHCFQYPVFVEGNGHLSPMTPLQQAFSGLASSDEICCITALSSQQLEEEIECDPGVAVIWK